MADIGTKRANDPVKREAWENCGLVEIQTLKKGDIFESVDGLYYAVVGRGKTGIILVDPWGRYGCEDTFIQGARVRPVMRTEYLNGGRK